MCYVPSLSLGNFADCLAGFVISPPPLYLCHDTIYTPKKGGSLLFIFIAYFGGSF